MKKKLQLKKEIVSILDTQQMYYLTKGGTAFQTFDCNASRKCVLDTKVADCGTLTTRTCVTELGCKDTEPCIVPGETNHCPLVTDGVACYGESEAVVNPCLNPISDLCAIQTVLEAECN